MLQRNQSSDDREVFGTRAGWGCRRFALVAVTVAALGLGGCFGGGSSGGGSSDPDSDDDEVVVESLTLSVTPDIMAVHLNWSGSDSVNVLFSTERECDWENYNSCENGRIRMGVAGGTTTLVAVDEGLDSRQPWYFAVETDGVRSETQVSRPLAPGAEGTIHHAAVHDDRLYLGGNFDGVGGATGSAVAFNARTGELHGALPPVDDRVNVVAPDDEGGWFIAGRFSMVGGYERDGLARLRSDGTLVSDWAPEIGGGEVRAISADGGRVYLAGNFDTVNGIDRDGLAAVELATGDLVQEWHPVKDGNVFALLARENHVYLAGSLRNVDGESYERIVRVDNETGAASPSWEWDGLDNSVDFLEYMDGILFIAARGFRDDDGDRHYVMALDPETGYPLEGWMAPSIDDEVEDMIAADGLLYVGVDRSVEPLRVVHADTGKPLGTWSFDVDDYVEALAWHDGVLFVAGGFEEINGQPRENLVAVDGRSGALVEGQVPMLDDRPYAMASRNGIVMAGGGFQIAAMQHRENLAVLDARTGQLLDRAFGVDNTVRAMTLGGERLYVGGNFDHATGHGQKTETRGGLAAFSLEDGSLDPQWQPPSASPHTILHHGYRVYVGGALGFSIGSREVLGAVDAITGNLLAWETDLDDGDRAYALAARDGVLYVAGNMSIDGTTSVNLAAFSMDSGDHYADWAKDLSIGITSDRALLATEEFIFARTADGSGVAAHYPQGEMPATGEDAAWEMPGARPMALLEHQGGLYVGGNFTTVDGGAGGASVDRDRLARVDLSEVTLDAWNPGADGRVRTLTTLPDGSVFVGGSFDLLGSGSAGDEGGYVSPNMGVVDAGDGTLRW